MIHWNPDAGMAGVGLLPVRSDRMEPTLRGGKDAVLYIPMHRFAYDALYVLDGGDNELVVWRCGRSAGGDRLIPDNKFYVTFELSDLEFRHMVRGLVVAELKSSVGHVDWPDRRPSGGMSAERNALYVEPSAESRAFVGVFGLCTSLSEALTQTDPAFILSGARDRADLERGLQDMRNAHAALGAVRGSATPPPPCCGGSGAWSAPSGPTAGGCFATEASAGCMKWCATPMWIKGDEAPSSDLVCVLGGCGGQSRVLQGAPSGRTAGGCGLP